MFRCLLACVLVACTTAAATAQTSDAAIVAGPSTTAIPSAVNWPTERFEQRFALRLDVVTIARPGVRQRCNNFQVTTDTVTCRSKHHHTQQVFQREDVAALIDPPYHGDRAGQFALLGVAMVALAGSFFVPLGWSLLFRILLCPAFLLGAGFGGNNDHDRDNVIYQRPGTRLHVPLHS